MNRIEAIYPETVKTNDPEDLMLLIMEALNDTVTPIPDVGQFCTFVYIAKTPGIAYDQHPLVAVTELYPWGFQGINYHWEKTRRYTWEELAGQVYIVEKNELDDLLALPNAKVKTNEPKDLMLKSSLNK